SVLGRIELRASLLDKLVKALGFQQLIQLLVKGMPRRGCQLGVRDPQSLLLLPLLARAHRHSAILRTISVDTSDVFAYESRLAPRPVRGLPRVLHLLPFSLQGYVRQSDYLRLELCKIGCSFRIRPVQTQLPTWNVIDRYIFNP